MIRSMLTASALAVCGLAMAKLPAPVLDDAAKAKAAETAARAAWTAKVDAYLTCKAQDRAVANHKKTVAARPAASAPAMLPTATAPAAATTAAPTPATAASGTPVAASAPSSACADPGPFAYAPPAEKPLETSGAHSPAANATSPPSVRAESAKMAPAGPTTAQSKKP